MDSPGVLYGSMVVLLALSAFFSASETSFTSVNMIRIRNMAEEGNRKAAAAVRLAESYDRTLSTILIGNNLVNIALSSLTTVAATTAFGDAGVAIATGVATLLILTFGEILPKSWAKENSEQLVLVIAFFTRWAASSSGCGGLLAKRRRGKRPPASPSRS